MDQPIGLRSTKKRAEQKKRIAIEGKGTRTPKKKGKKVNKIRAKEGETTAKKTRK